MNKAEKLDREEKAVVAYIDETTFTLFKLLPTALAMARIANKEVFVELLHIKERASKVSILPLQKGMSCYYMFKAIDPTYKRQEFKEDFLILQEKIAYIKISLQKLPVDICSLRIK